MSRERIRLFERVLVGAIIVLSIYFILCGCAGQELANVANQGKYHASKIEDWGQNTAEILTNTATAMDALDVEFTAVLEAEDPEAKRAKIRTIEERINSIGSALYSIDISVPIVEIRKVDKCFDAIIDFAGKTPEHADDSTLSLHLYKLGEAKLKIEKFKAKLFKITSVIGTAIPGGSWLDHIWKLVLGATTSYAGFRGLQHRVRANRAEKHNGIMVKAVNNLNGNGNTPAYKAIKKELKGIPEGEKASFKVMVAKQLAKIRIDGGSV